ncbi:MAG: hypothetical protein AAF383_19045, partial [Cyanobacteria bacterium P01_A01_bin.83]
MDLRLVKVFLTLSQEQNIRKLLSDYSCLDASFSKSEQQLLVNILLEEEQVKTLVDSLKQKMTHLEDWQLLILPVEIESVTADSTSPKSWSTNKDSHLPQQEIYQQISDSIRLDTTEVSLVILSTAIAAIGLVQNSEVVIIGAMVIAPLLKPNMALGIATT